MPPRRQGAPTRRSAGRSTSSEGLQYVLGTSVSPSAFLTPPLGALSEPAPQGAQFQCPSLWDLISSHSVPKCPDYLGLSPAARRAARAVPPAPSPGAGRHARAPADRPLPGPRGGGGAGLRQRQPAGDWGALASFGLGLIIKWLPRRQPGTATRGEAGAPTPAVRRRPRGDAEDRDGEPAPARARRARRPCPSHRRPLPSLPASRPGLGFADGAAPSERRHRE